jgi:hypothetical protein
MLYDLAKAQLYLATIALLQERDIGKCRIHMAAWKGFYQGYLKTLT